eukprot:2345277-Pleurochrysis_carterae.AAC.1
MQKEAEALAKVIGFEGGQQRAHPLQVLSHNMLCVEHLLKIAEFVKSKSDVLGEPLMALQKLLEAGALAPSSQPLGVSRERSPLIGRAARPQTPRRFLKLF